MPENTSAQRNGAALETSQPDGPLHFAVPLEESEETIAANHQAELAGISGRFPGVEITVGPDWRTWRAEHDGCVHETHGEGGTSGMGALQRELWHCVGGLW